MSDTTDTTPVTATIHSCVVCEVKLIGGIAVSMIEAGSGPGHTLYACRGCVAHKNLLPLEEQDQPAGDGRLQFRDSTTR